MLTRLDDGLIDHEKIERAADVLGRYGYERALGAATWGIVYANRRLTDGHLLRRALEKYQIATVTADALVTVGLWTAVADGYQIHDFLDWNASAAEVKAKQRKDRARKRTAFGFRTDSERSPDGIQTEGSEESVGIPRAVVIQDRLGTVPTSAVPDPEPVPVPAVPDPALLKTRFDTFWAAYGKREQRIDALKAFTKLNPDPALLAQILAAIVVWKGSRKWRDGFQPLASRWLNSEGWTDEVPQEPVVSGPLTRGERAEQITKQSLETFLATLRTTEANHAAIDIPRHDRHLGVGVGLAVRRDDDD